jgi:hypothetical protein
VKFQQILYKIYEIGENSAETIKSLRICWKLIGYYKKIYEIGENSADITKILRNQLKISRQKLYEMGETSADIKLRNWVKIQQKL